MFTAEQILALSLLLCQEKDEAKALELANALRDMLAFNVEEAKSKVEYLAKHYPGFGEPSDPAA